MKIANRLVHRSQIVLLVTIVILLLAVHYNAGADTMAAGDVDTSFAGFGETGHIDFSDMQVLEFASHLDEGWVVLGKQGEQLLIRRYSYDGQLDTAFGQQGTARFSTNGDPCAPAGSVGCGIAVRSDGEIIVVGTTKVGDNRDFLAFRLHANGELDISFGQNGSRTIDFDGGDDTAYAVAIQENGQIVIAGTVTDVDTAAPDDLEFGTVRLTRGGNLDNSFNGSGRATVSFGGGHFGQNLHIATTVAIQPNGQIVVAGQADDSSSVFASGADFDFGLARYNSDGSLDSNFDGDGKLSTGFGHLYEQVVAVYIQPDRKIVAAGFAGDGGDLRFALARYNFDGSLDNTFDGDGKMRFNPGYDVSRALAIVGQADGKLVVLGTGDGNAVIARFNKDGSPDSTFSDDGVQVLRANQSGNDLALQPDGKIVVGTDASFRRYRADLALDKAGQNATGFGYGSERGVAVMRHADGSYLIASEIRSPLVTHGTDVALTRYHANGQLDRSFGYGGQFNFPLPNDDAARDMVVLPNGKIVVGGFRHQTVNDDFALWRFTADGVPDGSFGSGGFTLASFGIGADYGQEMVLQSDGKIVLAGFSENNSGRFLTMARFDADGDLDTSFADNGKFAEARGQDYFSLRALAQLPDGDLLAAGGQGGDFWAYRFSADGVPDPSFGTNGYREYELIGNDEAHAIGLLPNGVIVIGGYAGGDFGLLFILDDGSMCLTICNFAEESRIRIDLGGDEAAYDLVVQSNGKIILAGSARNIAESSSGFLLARVTSITFPVSGYGLDTSFGTGGMLAVPFLGGARAHAIALHHDKIVLAGLARNGVDTDIALARLINDHSEPLNVEIETSTPTATATGTTTPVPVVTPTATAPATTADQPEKSYLPRIIAP